MGWLIVGLFVLVFLSIFIRFHSRWKTPGRHKVKDVDIYDRVEQACLESGDKQGEFEIDLGEISDRSWLEIGSHAFAEDQFRGLVKWRNQGNQCVYKFVATAGEGEDSVTKQSPKHVIPLKS